MASPTSAAVPLRCFGSSVRADTLERVGRALYGTHWQTDLARDLGVHDRTVRHWAAGARPIPEGIPADLLALVKARGKVLAELTKALA